MTSYGNTIIVLINNKDNDNSGYGYYADFIEENPKYKPKSLVQFRYNNSNEKMRELFSKQVNLEKMEECYGIIYEHETMNRNQKKEEEEENEKKEEEEEEDEENEEKNYIFDFRKNLSTIMRCIITFVN